MPRKKEPREEPDLMALEWYLELVSTWRRVARIIAQVAKRFYPGSRVYVFGGAAEGRLTALSDLDILVVLPYEPSPRERLQVKKRILMEAFEQGVPWDYPVDLHVTGPKGFEGYKRYARRMVEL